MPMVIHCILNNLTYEQRLHKIALTFAKEHLVEVVGIVRSRMEPIIADRPYRVSRLRVPFRRGPLFFLVANLQMFLYLLFRRGWNAVLASDLNILPACWLAASLKGKSLLLDSRELYTQTPFLKERAVRRFIWELAERFLYPKVGYILAVSPPIADYFSQRYKKPVWVVYNLPLRGRGFARPRLENRLLLYQGLLHPYRGLEELILALGYVRGWKLWVVGDGPLRPYLETLAKQQRLMDRITFFGLVPFEAIQGYTQQATFGVSGEIPHVLNHKYALPNKAFDYLQQGIPLLVGEAPLLQALVRHYGCGRVVERWQPREIAYTLEEIEHAHEMYDVWVEKARVAAKELHWERQEPCLRAWLNFALAKKPLPPQGEIKDCHSVTALAHIYRQDG
ncbi:MAG: glycosyltransferase [Bacteroidia bacterium]|nr:glycosyltransferase [Bacteroidia bacterium]